MKAHKKKPKPEAKPLPLKKTTSELADLPTEGIFYGPDGDKVEWVTDGYDMVQKPIPDDMRFVDSNPGCSSPEVFEFFNKGKICVTKCDDRQCFEMEDTGSGFKFRGRPDESWQRLDYSTAHDLIRAMQIMNIMQRGSIFGKGWVVDFKGRVVENFNKLLQIIEDHCNTK